MGKVILAGAGCGSLDLLTLRAWKAVREADCILYDALIDMRILKLAKETCECINVGKRSGHHQMTQEQINALLLRKAIAHARVVRLKGGDPFVLGRGGEEALFLHEHGIETEVIPGISSAIAVPELAGIPLTHRTLAHGFHVIDAHEPQRIRFDALVAEGNTCVFLMGLAHLPKITQGLLRAGMDPKLPSAVISQGACNAQQVLYAPLAQLADRFLAAPLPAPAIIVTGTCAALHPQLYSPLPLQGVQVGIAAFGSGDKLAWMLEEKGAVATQLCMAEAIAHLDALDEISFTAYDWLIFTSPRAVSAFISWMKARGKDVRQLTQTKIAVVGSACAESLQAVLLQPDLIAAVQDAAHLGEQLAKMTGANTRLLHLCGELHDDALRARFGSQLQTRVIYHMKHEVRQEACGKMDYVIFTCASAAAACAGMIDAAKAIAIGDRCAQELRQQGIKEIINASAHSLAGCIDALIQDREEKR